MPYRPCSQPFAEKQEIIVDDRGRSWLDEHMTNTRYTSKDAKAAFGRLCVALNKHSQGWNVVGSWFLDHNSVYGGYVVEEIVNVSGGITHPLGDTRHNAREFCELVNFSLRVLEQAR